MIQSTIEIYVYDGVVWAECGYVGDKDDSRHITWRRPWKHNNYLVLSLHFNLEFNPGWKLYKECKGCTWAQHILTNENGAIHAAHFNEMVRFSQHISTSLTNGAFGPFH